MLFHCFLLGSRLGAYSLETNLTFVPHVRSWKERDKASSQLALGPSLSQIVETHLNYETSFHKRFSSRPI